LDKQLKVLPKEEIISSIHGVWNLSSDQVSQKIKEITKQNKNCEILLFTGKSWLCNCDQCKSGLVCSDE
jgi:hypothetical protein